MNAVTHAPETLDRRALLAALRTLRKGDFTVRLPLGLTGIDGEIAQVFNDVAELNESMTEELSQVCEQVGKEGQNNRKALGRGAVGSWASKVEAVNSKMPYLQRLRCKVARGIETEGIGDLSQRMLLDGEG